ncbi:MAG: helix-turn-helix transcriptional regulator [Oscillospiraceae bacterium]|jgi:DNA-binding CsgD family transcriptional regulator|nr:helix-turn-helix transcriptional regulator [Oscillospiraceae bacterium]
MIHFSVLSNIIYRIYSTENERQMRLEFLENIGQLIDFDSADFFLAKKDGSKGLECPVAYNCETERVIVYDRLDYSRIMLYSGKSLVYRETDIIDDARRVQTEYYANVYKPNGWHYALQFILGHNEKFCGCVTFYRFLGREDFTQEDVQLLDLLKDHMSLRLYRDSARTGRRTADEVIANLDCSQALTKKERQIILLLSAGKNNGDICGLLGIKENTLKKHLLHIYGKLQVNSKVELISKFV